MKLEKTITIFATEEARKKWEGKELPVKNKKKGCPDCEIKKDILPSVTEEDLNNDILPSITEEDLK
jgi:hypothetical protein